MHHATYSYCAFADWAILGSSYSVFVPTPLGLSDLQHKLIFHPSNNLRYTKNT